jgi:RHH-type proline utilization regulon transcriptional repressor/proline dehydrogenase/delta 1-pyrroline-5-carboxylate dehydrogenase
VLGIIRADDVDHAIAIQNDSEFGLTAGLQALDPAEVERWLDRVEAGNVYVNRGTTGAIVQRQPFGGWKRSSVGATAKAGGPNYVASLMRWADDVAVPLDEVTSRFERWMATVGSAEPDVSGLRGEHNRFRYRTGRTIAVRFGVLATERERRLIVLAARATGARLVSSDAADEGDHAFASALAGLGADRLRLVGLTDEAAGIRRACHAVGTAVDDAPVVAAPEIELPRWLREQSVCITAHRHGRVVDALR